MIYKMKILIKGFIFNGSSISKINYNLIKCLRNNHCVRYIALDSSHDNHELRTLRYVERETSFDIELRHYYPPTWEYSKHKLIYIIPWEFERIPLEWIINLKDKYLIVPSEWTRRNYLKSGLNPDMVFTVPNGYNPEIYFPLKPSISEKSHKRYLYVGSHQLRKGLDILLNVWKTLDIQNQLTIKLSTHVYGFPKKLIEGENIKVITEKLSEQEMGELYRNHDVLIHPHRGESYAMNVCEALACGLDVIVPERDCTEEYLTSERIKIKKVVVDPYDFFAIKKGDSLSLMGTHFSLNEPLQQSLKFFLIKSIKHKLVKNFTVYDWMKISEKYIEIFNICMSN